MAAAIEAKRNMMHLAAPNASKAFAVCSMYSKVWAPKGLTEHVQQAIFFFGRLTFLATPKPGMALWLEQPFVFLALNSTRASSYFRVPSEQVIEIGWVIADFIRTKHCATYRPTISLAIFEP